MLTHFFLNVNNIFAYNNGSMHENSSIRGGEGMERRTDLAVEAREIAGEQIGGVDFKTYSENGLSISRMTVKTPRASILNFAATR